MGKITTNKEVEANTQIVCSKASVANNITSVSMNIQRYRKLRYYLTTCTIWSISIVLKLIHVFMRFNYLVEGRIYSRRRELRHSNSY